MKYINALIFSLMLVVLFMAANAQNTQNGKFLIAEAIPFISSTLNNSKSDSSESNPQKKMEVYDIVVYGGTSGGVMAAVQAARMGKKVVLIEPGVHLGGLTSGGLGWVDVGNPKTIGGLAREYFHRVWKHYQDDAAWKWEKKHKMQGQHAPLAPEDETMWIVEPSVAERLFDQMATEANVTIVSNERLNRGSGVIKEGQKIVSIAMESGRVFQALMFIDATYEGDLMAASGVSYFVGREPNSLYNETINGIRPLPVSGRFPEEIDPYNVKGDPKSGLLPRVYPDWGGKWAMAIGEYRLTITGCALQKFPETGCLLKNRLITMKSYTRYSFGSSKREEWSVIFSNPGLQVTLTSSGPTRFRTAKPIPITTVIFLPILLA